MVWQDCISHLCDAVAQGKVGEGYILRYMELMAGANEQSPRAPNVCRLGFGALTDICVAMKVPPPTQCTRTEIENARNRLRGLPGQGQFELSRHLCSLAQADLAWLGTQPVLGSGSVVLHGSNPNAGGHHAARGVA